ncbi:MAG: hypothetical protein ACREPQ_00895 [Rhodanobacter sp.]
MDILSPATPPPSLASLLQRLRVQVLETRDQPSPPKPGEMVAEDIYAAAEDVRLGSSLRP